MVFLKLGGARADTLTAYPPPPPLAVFSPPSHSFADPPQPNGNYDAPWGKTVTTDETTAGKSGSDQHGHHGGRARRGSRSRRRSGPGGISTADHAGVREGRGTHAHLTYLDLGLVCFFQGFSSLERCGLRGGEGEVCRSHAESDVPRVNSTSGSRRNRSSCRLILQKGRALFVLYIYHAASVRWFFDAGPRFVLSSQPRCFVRS